MGITEIWLWQSGHANDFGLYLGLAMLVWGSYRLLMLISKRPPDARTRQRTRNE
jgi:hypothetical protein